MHPTDGWQVEQNITEGVLYADPHTAREREAMAQTCALNLTLSMPVLIDDMANSTDEKYYALPDRLYLIGADGRIAYRGAPGPFGFVAEELGAAIAAYLGSA